MSDSPQFNHDKAHRVIEELTSAMRVLNQQTQDRTNNAKTLQQNWKGHHADQFFNTEMPRIQNQAAELVRRMQDIIRAVNGADTAAKEAETQWQRRQPQPLPTPGPTATPASPPSSTPSPQPGPAPTPPPTPGR